MRLRRLLTRVVVSSLSFTATALARPPRVNQIPNGSVNGCANCHINPAGGGPRNAFGSTIESAFLLPAGSTGVVQWGPALAAAARRLALG